MSDETTNASADAPAPSDGTGLDTAAAATIAVQSGQALLVARFAGMDDAKAAYGALREAEVKGTADIHGVLVVRADEQGKVHIEKLTDHATRNGLRWGVVAGAAIGLIFPPSILAGAVVAGISGAAMGKAYNWAKKDTIALELAAVVAPGTSGIVALVAIDAVDDVRAAIPQAVLIRSVPVDADTADALRAAAAAAGDTPNS